MRFPKAVRRFLLGYLVLHLLAVAIFVLILTRITKNQMVHDARTRMRTMATMLADYVDRLDQGLNDASLPAMLKKIGQQTNVRFTLVNDQGTVLADSETGTRDIGPHGTREEVLLAKANGSGFSQRYSATLDQSMMYFASLYQPADHQAAGYIRVAIPANSIDAAIGSLQRLIWLFAIGTSLLTASLMAVFSFRSMKPLSLFSASARQIAKGEYAQNRLGKYGRDEWAELARAFELMQNEIIHREDRLLENSHRLEAVLSSMIEGVLAVGPAGEVMLANRAACKMFCLEIAQLQGRKLLDVVRIPELREAIEKTRQHGTFSKTEFQTLTSPKRRLRARVSPLAKESEPGVAVVLHDVTELRQLETMRQDFVANVSHELKTPLSSIKAYAETLRLGAINDQERNLEFVERIETQAELLDRQIHDLLELARVESGDAAFRISDVPINEVCQDCYEQFAPIATENQLQLQLRICPGNPLARADQKAIETVVANLVVNAIHYTPAGGRVTIETGAESGEAVIIVSDTGLGIASEHQTRVFERFYRVDRARSRDKGGTGLGLAIVKHLTQAFGGSVKLDSQIGKGSRFQVRLPISLAATDNRH